MPKKMSFDLSIEAVFRCLPSSSPNLHKNRILNYNSVKMDVSSIGCRGLFSLKDFEPGEVILKEVAVCWQDEGGEGDGDVHHTIPESDLEETLFQMAPFHGTFSASLPRRALVKETMRSNSWGCSSNCRGLFPILCLSNNSCDPCASAEEETCEEGVAAGPVYVLRARKKIHVGDEITASYCVRSWPKLQRKEHLLKLWGFECKCVRCSSLWDDTIIRKCQSCKIGLLYAPDPPQLLSFCNECGNAATFSKEEEELEIVEHWSFSQCQAFATKLLKHPTLALDDAKCFTALSGLFWAVSKFEEGGELRDKLLCEIVTVALRSRFVCLQDLGIEVEQ